MTKEELYAVGKYTLADNELVENNKIKVVELSEFEYIENNTVKLNRNLKIEHIKKELSDLKVEYSEVTPSIKLFELAKGLEVGFVPAGVKILEILQRVFSVKVIFESLQSPATVAVPESVPVVPPVVEPESVPPVEPPLVPVPESVGGGVVGGVDEVVPSA